MKIAAQLGALLLPMMVLLACSSTPTWEGMSQTDIAAWKELGISVEDAQKLAAENVTPEAAGKWQDAGIKTLDRILAWQEAGFNPEDGKAWVTEGIDLDTAAEWAKKQFTAEEARAWIDSGFSLSKAEDNRSQGLTPIK